jgi:SagB-type dehydrogenase family enzyme
MYHDRTKHHLHRPARSLGYLDWANQPDPFRRYEQSSTFPLEHPQVTATPTYDALFNLPQAPAEPVNRSSISHLFYESLAISAWKQAGNNRWSLRVNPSSGDLHPTEAYLIAGPIKEISETAAVYHYSPYGHALERRVTLTHEEWTALTQGLPPGSLLIALSSIYWRESWKYGERAFRYCQHDVGHALGALTFAAAALGWETRLVHSVMDNDLALLTGIAQQEGIEAEHPDCLLAVYSGDVNMASSMPVVSPPDTLLERLRTTRFEGRPNKLSKDHHAWPIIDAIADACRFDKSGTDHGFTPMENSGLSPFKGRQVSARKIIRQRRSAVAMDGRTTISRDTFYRMMAHVSPHPGNQILKVLPWRPHVALALFIHRVEDLPTGLYLLVRDPVQEPSLKQALRPDFHWTKPAACPETLPLYLLQQGDFRETAQTISCRQEIAADGAFALGMLAEFETGLELHGASFYPRLFWETGLIGQILYLEAEAAEIRATGIGCFFDDAMHEVLGLEDHTWQSLYHFTVGGSVDDTRLQSLPAYWHLKQS